MRTTRRMKANKFEALRLVWFWYWTRWDDDVGGRFSVDYIHSKFVHVFFFPVTKLKGNDPLSSPISNPNSTLIFIVELVCSISLSDPLRKKTAKPNSINSIQLSRTLFFLNDARRYWLKHTSLHKLFESPLSVCSVNDRPPNFWHHAQVDAREQNDLIQIDVLSRVSTFLCIISCWLHSRCFRRRRCCWWWLISI